MEDDVMGSSLIWGHIVCNISYIIKSTVSYIRTSTDYKWLNNRSFVKKKLNYANCITVFLIYVCFVKEMCKL